MLNYTKKEKWYLNVMLCVSRQWCFQAVGLLKINVILFSIIIVIIIAVSNILFIILPLLAM